MTSVVAPGNTIAMALFTAGMTMFSGSIYLLVLDAKKYKSLGPVTPIGGACLDRVEPDPVHLMDALIQHQGAPPRLFRNG